MDDKGTVVVVVFAKPGGTVVDGDAAVLVFAVAAGSVKIMIYVFYDTAIPRIV